MTDKNMQLEPLDPLPWKRKGLISRYNPSSDPNVSGDPNIECFEGLFEWIRPDRGMHPDHRRVAEIAERQKRLAELAQRTNSEINVTGQRVISLAMLLKEARAEFDRSNGGAMSWKQWLHDNIGLGPSRVGELLRIANSDDPVEELRRLREKVRGRVSRNRSKDADEKRIEEMLLIFCQRTKITDWLHNANDDEAAKVWQFIDGLPKMLTDNC